MNFVSTSYISDGLIRTATFLYSTFGCVFVILYSSLKQLVCTSVIWNSISSTGINKLESTQQKLAALCCNSVFHNVNYIYANVLQYLKLHTFSEWLYQLDHYSFFFLVLCTLSLNSVLPFWAISVFQVSLGNLATLNVGTSRNKSVSS